MGTWVKDKVFANADDFLKWLDAEFGDYIEKHINQNHVHHTWSPSHKHYPKYSTLQLHKNMRSFHVTANGWSDIAQNITIGKDGDIVTGRDIQVAPVSATGHNGNKELHPFAYEMIGNFDKGNDIFEGKQLESAIKISRYFYKKGKAIKFHRELLLPNGKVPKTCPGTGIEKDWFMDLVRDSKFDVGNKVEETKPIENPITKPVEDPKVEVKPKVETTPTKNEFKPEPKQYIKLFQAWLNDNYKMGLVEDNLFGNKTQSAALKVLQKELNKQYDAKLVVDGVWGNKTKSVIPVVSEGDKGNIVRILQGMLYCLKYDPNGFDGVFGNGCEKAVKSLQKDNKLEQDGKAGKLTFEKLFK